MNIKEAALSLILVSASGNLIAQNPQETAPVSEVEVVGEAVETYDPNEIVIDPLFKYIEAPDNLPDLRSRTDYVMEHFWDPFDFKNSGTVDQNALNHAMEVYIQSMPYASEKKVNESVKKLVGKIKNNPGLSLQFAKAAEEHLYGPRAIYWIDDIYMAFLENVVSNKKISENKKGRYEKQYEMLKKTAKGAPLPSFNLVSLDDHPNGYNPGKEFNIIEFTAPDCDDCRYTNLKLDISSVVNDMLEAGRLDVTAVLLGEGYQEADVANMPAKWKKGYSGDALKNIDIRRVPCFYILDKNKNIVGKNLTVDDAIALIEELSSLPKK